ncbi:hypothetical protein GO730_10500 [Spirosoma sp. HMF3257]|uniref:Lipoprotein n=1 Tax=Spirosoma telluris TaxID=2183553 RepID=A0A327NID2_9BACT|nr:hypothetical protein [Spirosoma telluris]RAI74585.1 hypothetical protein HMF3257_10430 [Spirosoma telluris]
MKRLILICSLFVAITIYVSACEQEKVVLSVPCPNAGTFVKQANKLTGTVYYDSTKKSYGIQVATSFDSADMGYTCNLPTEFQKEQLKVRFTGSYYMYDKPINGPAGYKFYYLSLESVSL